MAKAIYAFSGDPITYGHIDIIKRAARVFDEVIVSIGANPDKKYMFSLEERTDMATRSLAAYPNVRVTPFTGLLVDFAYEQGVGVIVKGVRNQADMEYEKTLQEVGSAIQKEIDTFTLYARPDLAKISSSTVKAIQKEHGPIHEYVTLYVKQCLEARMSGQYILSVTGEIGCGKSYVGKKFEELGKENGIEVHNIELDEIGHQILSGQLKDPRYEQVRMQIGQEFGIQLMDAQGSIRRKSLGDIVFNDPEKLERLNKIMEEPIMVRVRREMYGKKGLILLNAALIAEAEMGYMSNNNALVVHANEASQRRRLEARGLTEEQIIRRLSTQYHCFEKHKRLSDQAKTDTHGKVWLLDNSDDTDKSEPVCMFETIIKELKVR